MISTFHDHVCISSSDVTLVVTILMCCTKITITEIADNSLRGGKGEKKRKGEEKGEGERGREGI